MRIKYPRTPHLPFSPGASDDDERLIDLSCFKNKEVIVTEKMDGENTTMTRDYVNARSVDSADHPSRHTIKALWASVRWDIPEGWRVCGENLYAQHSIAYDNLDSYFLVFAIWNEKNECLSWNDMCDWCHLIGLRHVPVLLSSRPWEEMEKTLVKMSDLWQKPPRNEFVDHTKHEGFVVRNMESFHYNDFSKNVAKWVRPNHVQTDIHWMSKDVVPNKLKQT